MLQPLESNQLRKKSPSSTPRTLPDLKKFKIMAHSNRHLQNDNTQSALVTLEARNKKSEVRKGKRKSTGLGF